MPRNVLVVGMPRSGTSMTAGIFTRAGYFVADEPEDELREGDGGNPHGYWEAESLIERNVEVFRAAGYDYHNTWLFDPIGPEAVRRIASLPPLPGHEEFVRSYDESAPWMWKDPRLCYTLAYWWKLLDPERTRIVLTQRDPEAIYQSFLRLGWREPSDEARADVLGRIDDHLAAARSAVDELEIPYMVMEYERAASDPDSLARAISSLCDLDLDGSDLGFDRRYDHSGLKGRLAGSIERSYARLPARARSILKSIVPRFVVAALFPERVQPGR